MRSARLLRLTLARYSANFCAIAGSARPDAGARRPAAAAACRRRRDSSRPCGRTPCRKSAAVCLRFENRGCSEWQSVQLSRRRFISSEPGALIIHSALVDLIGRHRGGLELEVGGRGPAGGQFDVRRDLRARTRRREWQFDSGPAPAESAGKAYSPLASLTTVMVIVEPGFLALTRTPSISPSRSELILPVNAGAGVCATADMGVVSPTATANIAARHNSARIVHVLPRTASSAVHRAVVRRISVVPVARKAAYPLCCHTAELVRRSPAQAPIA